MNAMVAQISYLGVKSGISIPDIKGNSEQSEGYTSREAFFSGVFFGKKISKHLILQTELNFSPQGGKRNGIQPISKDALTGISVPEDIKLYAEFNNKTILNYAELPVLVRMNFQPSKLFNYYGFLGPYISRLMKAQTVTSGTSVIYMDAERKIPLSLPDGTEFPPVSFDSKTNIRGDIKKINAGVTGGIGMEYVLWNGKILLEGRFTKGLTNIQTNTTVNGKNQTGSLIAAIGYAFSIY